MPARGTDQIDATVGLRAVAMFHERDVAQVVRRGPDQHARGVAVAELHGAVDLRTVPFVHRASFVIDASREVVLGGAAEDDDPFGRRIVSAQADDGAGAIVLLEPFGERHGPEQPGRIAALLPVGDCCEVFVLRRFHMLAPTTGVEVGERFGPYRFVRGLRLARGRVIEPDEDACRCDEQQQHQKRSKFHGGDRNSFRIPWVPPGCRAARENSADEGCIFYANEVVGLRRRIPPSELGIADLLRIFVLPSPETMPERGVFYEKGNENENCGVMRRVVIAAGMW